MAANRKTSLPVAAIFAAAQLAGVVALSLMAVVPARAQGFFDDRYPFFQDRWRRPQMPVEEEKPPDYSRAPAPKKAETPPTSTIMVFGDAMADWLAYGLEDTFSDTPEIGIVRKHKTYSGLIRYESRRDAPEWAQAAREIIAAEKPNFILMMLGLNDRQAIREVRPATPPPAAPGARAPGAQGTPPAPAAAGATQPAPKEQAPKEQAAGPKPDQNADPSSQPDPQDAEQQPAIAAPELPARPGQARAPVAVNHEYRTEKWEELYIKKIDDTIEALKSSGVPVYWVGLPALRGPRSTADMQYLNELYRSRAEKAGIAYVEVWDGFIDEAGRFTVQGPDFEGQIRRLRTSDGVYFTKAGARKLAHYVEREIRRDLNRVLPIALPVPEETPAKGASAPAVAAAPATAPATPAAPPARPLVGPAVPLTASASEGEELAGGSGSRSAQDNPASRVLVRGEPVATTAGRADDFSWPPRTPPTEFAGPLPAAPVVAVAAPKPSQPAQSATATAARPSGGGQSSGQPSRVAQQPQYPQYPRPTPGPYWRSPPSWGGGGGAWGGGGGGGGFFGLFR